MTQMGRVGIEPLLSAGLPAEVCTQRAGLVANVRVAEPRQLLRVVDERVVA